MGASHGREVVIVEAARTPIGRGHPQKGDFRDVHPNALLGATYTAVLERSGLDPAEVDAVHAGCVQQFGEQMLNIGRNAWLQAGLPDGDAGDHGRRAVRLVAAGGRHRRRRDRRGRARRGDRRGRRAHGAPAARHGLEGRRRAGPRDALARRAAGAP